MTDEEAIIRAESVGFTFYKIPNQWRWNVVAPDGEGITCEQGATSGMKWLREKLTYFIS